MRHCQVRPLRIPAGTAADRRAAIADELSVLGGAEEYEFDAWNRSRDDEAAPGMEDVIAVTVPQQSTAGITAAVAHCGLDCRTLDALPLALARAVRMVADPDDIEPVAAIDWGYADATFCVLIGPTPAFVRRLRDCGFHAVLEQAANKLGLNVEEVESLLLRGRGEDESVPRACRDLHTAIAELAAQPLRTMAGEMERTMAFVANQMPSALPHKAWLLGAGSLWNGGAEFLAAIVRRPVENWRFRNAGIERAAALPFPEEVLAAAVSLSTLAWART